jgi:hypothetical protein
MNDPQKPFSESGTSPPRRITVTSVRVAPGCSVALGEGLDECGRVLRFYGERRPMLAISGALEAGQQVHAYIHDWQVIAWARRRARA